MLYVLHIWQQQAARMKLAGLIFMCWRTIELNALISFVRF